MTYLEILAGAFVFNLIYVIVTGEEIMVPLPQEVQMLRVLVILSAGLVLSGCLATSVPKGYVSSDPCIRCGQGWQFMPNEPNASIRNAERIGFKYGMGADPKLP